jgi:DNA-binding transcriptional regulator/RsmH inhibitor MraZ
MLGLSNKIEIWSKDAYEKNRPGEEMLDNFAIDLGF